MNPFTVSELRELNDGLVELYSTHDLIPLMRKSIAMIQRWIPSDMTIYALTDPLYPQVTGIFEPHYHELPAYSPQYSAFCSKHPIMLHFLRTHDYSAIRFEDVIARAELEKLDLFNEFFKPLKIKDLMGIVCTDAQNRQMAIGSSRHVRFTDRERMRMETLRPHLSIAFQNAGMLAQAARKPFSPATILQEPRGSMLITTMTKIPGIRPNPQTLTAREIEILGWIGEGKSNPEIAIILNISPRTVQKHVEHLFVKLNVSSRTGAAIRSIEMGITSRADAVNDHEILVQKEARTIHTITAPRLIAV